MSYFTMIIAIGQHLAFMLPWISTGRGLMAGMKDRSMAIVFGYINIVKFKDNM